MTIYSLDILLSFPDLEPVWLIWKDPDVGKDWGQEEKGTIEDKMVGWHHRVSGHGFGWTLGVGDGQGGLACCGSWGHKESDITKRLNQTESLTASKQQLSLHLGLWMLSLLLDLPDSAQEERSFCRSSWGSTLILVSPSLSYKLRTGLASPCNFVSWSVVIKRPSKSKCACNYRDTHAHVQCSTDLLLEFNPNWCRLLYRRDNSSD